MRLRTAVVSYVVMMMNKSARNGPLTRSIRQADIVCANSNFVSQTVRECFGRDSHVIYDGVDRRFFFPSSRKSSGRLVVLYAGSFQPRKRVELIIEQAARQPDVDFWLAGKGETETNCRALSMRLGCRNVRFLGHLLPDQLGFHMRGADLFLFPSVLEGHPQVLLQAAASGLPCIAMNLYRPDYVVHGETGFLVDSDVQLSASLQLLLRDQKLRESMSSAAISHTQRFEWASITEQWGRIFEEAVGRRNEHLGRKADLCAATAGAE
jgi:glycosyltransferase involved in cell wall biosynthesis